MLWCQAVAEKNQHGTVSVIAKTGPIGIIHDHNERTTGFSERRQTSTNESQGDKIWTERKQTQQQNTLSHPVADRIEIVASWSHFVGPASHFSVGHVGQNSDRCGPESGFEIPESKQESADNRS
jgi:hypothetical protein